MTVDGRPRNSWAAILDSLRLMLLYGQRKKYAGEGFRIEDASTWELRYVEGSRVLTVGTGIRKGSNKWYDTWVTVEFPPVLKWNPPYESEIISEIGRGQIRENIEKYFKRFGIPHEFVE